MFEQSQSSLYPAIFDIYSPEQKQQSLGLDFVSFHSPGDIAAPSVDSFEYDLDLISQNHDLSAFQLELTQVDSAFTHNINIPTCGPGSAITFSTESSAQDTLSSYAESFYNSPTTSNYSFPLDVEMDFQRIRVDDYTPSQSALSILDGTVDPTSFGTLPPTPPRSPPVSLTNASKAFDKPYLSRTSYSDCGQQRRNSMSSDYYSLSYNSTAIQPTISPSHISNPLPVVPSTPRIAEDFKGDPRKKYKCAACPRGQYSNIDYNVEQLFKTILSEQHLHEPIT